MPFLLRLFIFLVSLGLAYLFTRYRHWFVSNFGHIYYAEKYLGGGGSYTFWPLFGAVLAIFGLLLLLGIIG